MKTWTLDCDARDPLMEGLRLAHGRGEVEPAVALGSKPSLVCLGLNPKRPPTVIDDCVHDAVVRSGLLTRPSQRDRNKRGALVRVRTKHLVRRPGDGTWRVIAGKPRILIHGAGQGSPTKAPWLDGVLEMYPGNVLKVWPQGDVRSYALWMEDEPRTAAWEHFAQRYPAYAKKGATERPPASAG